MPLVQFSNIIFKIDFGNDGGSGVNLKRKAELDARMKQREEELKKKHSDNIGNNNNESDPLQIAKHFDTQFSVMKKGKLT